MGAFYSGKDGELQIDGSKAAKVRGWQCSTSLGLLDTTTLGDRDRTMVPGIRSTSGTCDIYYYTTDPNDTTKNDASRIINKLIKSNTDGQGVDSEEVTIKLIINDGTTQPKYIQGKCLLTNASMTMAVGQVLSARISFQFIGSPREMLL